MLGFLSSCGTPAGLDTQVDSNEPVMTLDFDCDEIGEMWTFDVHLSNSDLASVSISMSSVNYEEVHELPLRVRNANGDASYSLDVAIVSLPAPGTGQTLYSCNDPVEVEFVGN